MQTILVGLISGFVVGVVCVAYVFMRTTRVIATQNAAEPGGDSGLPYSENLTSSGLMFMSVIGSGSLLWGFIGAGLYHLIRNEWQFFILSALLAAAIIVIILFSKTTFVVDKIILTIVIVMGLGFLIPWLI